MTVDAANNGPLHIIYGASNYQWYNGDLKGRALSLLPVLTGSIRILNDMARKFETAIIAFTHDEKIIPTFKRIYNMRDGVTYEETGEGRNSQ